jgi:hypothetical protein
LPLTGFQAELGRLLATNRTEDSYLAGGAAILAVPNSRRYSRDLDYFHDSAERVATAFAADHRLLEEAGRLYWSMSAQRFVAPDRSENADIVPHFGRPGGVLPRLLDAD